ncbi:hypothetical protein K435DRAFT_725516 [Dendrothele bispora CBS 962.96]|uniref:P-loop containing nucleoside triphosphate hydrolase protein n=1 Tax=Dendrothele bispora (strain CBS 962.96) TaxID=1314807 RepID=A0A4S8LUX8_DENBC|nr:hypothetical protein K435DRAFT_725516 [Dendrothele bispora CBS 962.96]
MDPDHSNFYPSIQSLSKPSLNPNSNRRPNPVTPVAGRRTVSTSSQNFYPELSSLNSDLSSESPTLRATTPRRVVSTSSASPATPSKYGPTIRDPSATPILPVQSSTRSSTSEPKQSSPLPRLPISPARGRGANPNRNFSPNPDDFAAIDLLAATLRNSKLNDTPPQASRSGGPSNARVTSSIEKSRPRQSLPTHEGTMKVKSEKTKGKGRASMPARALDLYSDASTTSSGYDEESSLVYEPMNVDTDSFDQVPRTTLLKKEESVHDLFDDLTTQPARSFSSSPSNTTTIVKSGSKSSQPHLNLVTRPKREKYPFLNQTIALKDHQYLGVQWMGKREKNGNRGGILSDDMGLGKTIQMYFRIAQDKWEKKPEERMMPTLIVTPLSIIVQWKTEIEKYKSATSRIKILIYHGQQRSKCSMYDILTSDIIITTYETLVSEYAVFTKLARASEDPRLSDYITGQGSFNSETIYDKVPGALFTVGLTFRRVVLDEAHKIRNSDTKSAAACYAVNAKFHWALTGTPIQNKIDDLYSLFHFLGIDQMGNSEWFQRHIAKPILEAKEEQTSESRSAVNELHATLKCYMLRRRKDDTINGRKILDLQPIAFHPVKLALNEYEREIYNALERRADFILRGLLELAASKKKKTLNIHCVWVLLLRLRQACLHPKLLVRGYKEIKEEIEGGPQEAGVIRESETTGRHYCSLCGFSFSSAVEEKAHRQACEQVVSFVQGMLARYTNGPGKKPRPSTKITATLDILEQIRARDPKDKTIIYSQFSTMLEVVAEFLEDKYEFVMYHGKMSEAQRQAALHTLKTNDKVTVILISLMAGGTGLNLTECNNVILVDLWWNPAVEEQAFGRAHRIGQTKKVHVYKLFTENTIETRILGIQKEKKAIARAALDNNEIEQVENLSREEIIQLVSSKPLDALRHNK